MINYRIIFQELGLSPSTGPDIASGSVCPTQLILSHNFSLRILW